MFGSRRLAKRSIVGTQVCAPWLEDGRYYPGIIQSTSEWANGQEVYNVYFPHQKTTKTFQDRDLIGSGFQTINIAYLRKGQKVFITHNSRETSGTVVTHNRETEDIVIEVELTSKDKIELIRRLEDVRLVESRRSARLQDHQTTNYSRMADLLSSESRRWEVSHSIDVPPSGKHRRQRQRHSSLPSEDVIDEELDDLMDMDDVDDDRPRSYGDRTPPPDDRSSPREVMDENMAAMVLTSLSCSPLSPGHRKQTFHEKGNSSPWTTGSSSGSSGVWGMGGGQGGSRGGVGEEARKSSSPDQSNSSSPDTQYLSSSAPAAGVTGEMLFGVPAIDEGIEVDDTEAFFNDELNAGSSRKRRLSTRTVFKCLWPSCKKLYNTCTGIEKHVRYEHLGPRKPQPISSYNSDSDESLSDHEEEFYYTEVEVSVDTVTQTFADMHTSSSPTNVTGAFIDVVTPPESSPTDRTGVLGPAPSDHDYQKKSSPLSIPHSSSSTGGFNAGNYDHGAGGSSLPGFMSSTTHHSRGAGGSLPGSLSQNPAKVSRSLSWQNANSKMSKMSALRAGGPGNGSSASYGTSPKSVPTHHHHHHKKSRSDTKKCRKYYGMENRDLWCTQCKWKKACTRFLDYYGHNNKIRMSLLDSSYSLAAGSRNQTPAVGSAPMESINKFSL